MNKRKFNKLINNKIKIENKFGEINKKIDYSQYKTNAKKTNRITEIFLNKKLMAITSMVILLGIFIPLIDTIKIPNVTNNNNTNVLISTNINSEINSSNVQSSACASYSSVVNNSSMVQSSVCASYSSVVNNSSIAQSSACNSSVVESNVNPPLSSSVNNSEYSSSVTEATSATQNSSSSMTQNSTVGEIMMWAVYGVVKNDENNIKRFYTDTTYDSLIAPEYIGYYNFGEVKVSNYTLSNGELKYEEGKEILAVDLPLGTRCYCRIIVDIIGNVEDYKVGDVNEVIRLII